MKNIKKWKAALYIRLSREDELQGESNSVSSQREILREFVKQHDDIEEFDCYIDDGWTGTNFERPAFSRMLNDIYSGKVNCVIVKDLSRFGRNYTKGGELITNEFVRLNVRFIACNNFYDSISASSSAAMSCITLGVTNVINESVSATTSVNVRATLNLNRKNGKFIGSFACYGYKKDPDDHHHLIIDEEAAKTVRFIFDEYINGKSILGITKELNKKGIPNPTVYKYNNGLKYKNPATVNNDGLWQDSTVRRILKNEIYTGTMVQGKYRNISYKDQRQIKVNEEEWYRVEGTHEAIITKESYNMVQQIFDNNIHSQKDKGEVYLFAGFVKCGCCGRAMIRKINKMPYGTYEYYRCSTNKKMSAAACTSHSIRIDILEKSVLNFLQTAIKSAADYEKIKNQINDKNATDNHIILSSEYINKLKEQKEKFLHAISKLYVDYTSELICKEEFLFIKKDINEKIATLEMKISEAEKNIALQNEDNDNEFACHFLKYGNITKLSRRLLVEMIDSIIIHEKQKIEINVKFKDEYDKIKIFLNN